MKRILFFLLLFFTFQVIQAQNANKKKSKDKKIKSKIQSEGFTFPLGKAEDSLFITFSKGTEETQLCLDGNNTVWLGREYPGIHYSTVIITFSKPVTSIDFSLSHFNFDPVGKEEIQDFILVNDQVKDVTSSASFSWRSGPETGLDASIPGGTIFNEKKHTILAADGNYGEGASGQLFISSHKPITQITFTQRVIYGVPNGVLISLPNFKLATNNDESSKTQKDSTIHVVIPQVLIQPVPDSLLQLDTIPETTENSKLKDDLFKDNPKIDKGSFAFKNDTTAKAEPAKKSKEITKKEHVFEKRMKSLEKSSGYTFMLCDEDLTKVTFYKGTERSQLSIVGDTSVWLGEINLFEDYSDIVVAFSKPVNSIDLVMKNFNNNNYGSEQIQNFSTMDNNYSDVSSTAKLIWNSGPGGATIFDEKDQIISAIKGRSGPVASGSLSISNTKVFSYISFTHKVNHGTPGGILVNVRYICPTPPKEKISPKNHQPFNEITTPIADNPIVDSISKEKELSSIKPDTIPPSVSVKSIEPVLKSNTKKVTVVVPVKSKPIVKSTPKKATTVTPKITSKKEPIKTKTVIKTPVKKAPEVKSPPKKTIPPKKVTVTNKPAKINTSNKKESKKSHEKKVSDPAKRKVVEKKVTSSRKQPYTLAQIEKLKAGEKIKLDQVYFKQSLPELLPDSYLQLDTLIIILNNHPKLEIELQGYTDNVGDPQKNIILSEQRVATVKNYLVSKGIAKERLTQKGFGSSDPLIDNSTEANRMLNRRVEFMITKK